MVGDEMVMMVVVIMTGLRPTLLGDQVGLACRGREGSRVQPVSFFFARQSHRVYVFTTIVWRENIDDTYQVSGRHGVVTSLLLRIISHIFSNNEHVANQRALQM